MVVLKPLPELAAFDQSGAGSSPPVSPDECDHRWVPSWCLWLTAVAELLLGGVLLGSLLLRGSAWAAEREEYAIKAAYLYNFAKFVEWPLRTFPADDAPLSICIVGDNPFGNTLEMLAGKAVKNHPVEVLHVPEATRLDLCHIVFIGRAEQRRFKVILAKIARLPILTVSDISDFAQAGGIIGFFEAEQRIRFSINIAAAEQANLKLSSQLLKLAVIVN